MAKEKQVRNKVIAERIHDFVKQTVTLVFTDGKRLVLDFTRLPKQTAIQTALHGLDQKCSDKFAGCAGDVTLARETASGVFDRLCAGDWKVKGTGVAAEIVAVKVIARMVVDYPAIAKLAGGRKASEVWAALTDDQKKALRASAEFRTSKSNLEKDAAKAAPSATAVLGG